MATYNGQKYIREQLCSIIPQLRAGDEIIISDDGSTDDTLAVIEKFNCDKIRIVQGPQKGVKQNFANAISECKGNIIFLVDQDDIWYPNKLEVACKKLSEFPNDVPNLFCSNSDIIDAEGNKIKVTNNSFIMPDSSVTIKETADTKEKNR